MAHAWKAFAAFVIAAMLAACGHAPAPLTHDAYVWQRQWTPALREALDSSSDLVGEWRVLAAQADRDGRFHIFAPDRDALARSGRPVVFVLRIDGRLAAFDEAALVSHVVEMVRHSPVSLAGVEIDYDCPTSRLPAYTSFLSRLKAQLGPLPLSITALPTWIGSVDLDSLLAVPDEAVLQLHAVQAPQAGLFDPLVARAWLDDFAKHTRKPFRAALPTYGSRVSWNADGSLLAVESESAALAAGVDAAELYAAPSVVRDFVAGLERDRPDGLAGVVWFRLPTADDTRAWSLATWRGVVTGRLDATPLRVSLRAGKAAGEAFAVVVENPGESDAVAPGVVSLPASCSLADGIDGYTLHVDALKLELVAGRARPIPARTQRSIGWARCGPGAPVTLSYRAQGAPLS
jgi:hypothetical protein